MITFVIGGMTGVLLAVPPADFVLHNSLFLVAHFHNVIIGGVLFGLFAGINYWFPKAFGYKLDAFWGKCSFWFWIDRLLRRLHAAVRARPDGRDPPPEPLRRSVAADLVPDRRAVGAVLIAARHRLRCWCSSSSAILRRDSLRDVTGDPWNGRTLEWSTSSPPPDYNFAFTPIVHDNDAWADMKKRGYRGRCRASVPIHMPKNTGAGFIIAALARGVRLRADLAHVAGWRRVASPR